MNDTVIWDFRLKISDAVKSFVTELGVHTPLLVSLQLNKQISYNYVQYNKIACLIFIGCLFTNASVDSDSLQAVLRQQQLKN